jgi:radical SAM superfamily enzyme YgiQ (UPF0313 family)
MPPEIGLPSVDLSRPSPYCVFLPVLLSGDFALAKQGWKFVDGLLRGEGEKPILMLAHASHTGQELAGVGSLVYRDGARVQSNPLAFGVSYLDNIPDPALDRLNEADDLLAYLRVSTSKGCTSHRTSCNAPQASNRVGPAAKSWRGYTPGRVVDEIERLVSTYGCNTFDFVNSTFEDPGGGTLGKQHVAAIADELLGRGLKIFHNVSMQATKWAERDRDLLLKLWLSGLEKVLVRIESGSEVGLGRWQKKSIIADNTGILRLLRETGVYVAFGFISFDPWTTFEEYDDNVAFLHANMDHNLRRFTTRLELYPGSEVIGQLEREGLVHPVYLDNLNNYGYRFQDDMIAASRPPSTECMAAATSPANRQFSASKPVTSSRATSRRVSHERSKAAPLGSRYLAGSIRRSKLSAGTSPLSILNSSWT